MPNTFTVHLAEDYPYDGTDLEFAKECLRDFLSGEEPLSVVDQHGIVGVFYLRDLL